MIEIKNVSLRYKNKEIIKGLDLNIKENQITALIGPNGAGKTTLLKIACNLINPSAGEVIIDGNNIKDLSSKAISKQVSILKQIQNLNLKISVRDLVSFGRFPHSQGRLSKQDEKIIEQALEYLELTYLADNFVDELSGGQKQRAYIAMILAQDTKYVFLDEPLNNLDIKHSVEMMSILRKMVTELNKTVVIVMHDINFTAAYADEIVALKQGKIIKTGTPKEIVDKQTLQDIYDHNFNIAEVCGKKICVYFNLETKKGSDVTL